MGSQGATRIPRQPWGICFRKFTRLSRRCVLLSKPTFGLFSGASGVAQVGGAGSLTARRKLMTKAGAHAKWRRCVPFSCAAVFPPFVSALFGSFTLLKGED